MARLGVAGLGDRASLGEAAGVARLDVAEKKKRARLGDAKTCKKGVAASRG